MYELGDAFEGRVVDAGTNILIAGPPLTGKRRLSMGVLAAGANAGEGSVIVTTREGADRVLADYRPLLANPDDASVGVVDCVTRHQGLSESDSSLVQYTSSPVDMTGIGIEFSEFLEEFYARRGVERNRVMLDSLSPLLTYSDAETVFRFLHVLTSRVEDADALGLYTIESTAHDAETVDTLKQLFDGIVEVDDDGRLSVDVPAAGE